MKKDNKVKEAKKRTPEDLVNSIQEACRELGWNIAMNESSPGINGLVIGNMRYVEGILEQIVEQDDYSIYSAGTVSTEMQ